MDSKENKIVERYKERIRKQNQHVKDNYDKISATLPKGAIERIKALGMTINGAVKYKTGNASKPMCENTRGTFEESDKPLNDPVELQTAQTSDKTESIENDKPNADKLENRAYKEPLDIIALQAELNARKAEQDAREEVKAREKEEEQRKRGEEYINMAKALREGTHPQEDEAKERARQESIARAKMEY